MFCFLAFLFFLGCLLSLLEGFSLVLSLIVMNVLLKSLQSPEQSFLFSLTETLDLFSFSFPFVIQENSLPFFLSLYFVFVFLIRCFQGIVWGFLAEKFVYLLRMHHGKRVFQSSSYPSLSQFFLRLGGETSEIGFAFLHLFQTSLLELIKIFVILFLFFRIQNNQKVIFFMLLLCLLFFLKKSLSSLGRSVTRVQTEQFSFLERIWHRFRVWETIVSFDQKEKELKNISDIYQKLFQLSQKLNLKKAFLSPLIEALVLILFLCLFGGGVFFLQFQEISLALLLNQIALGFLLVLSFKTLISSLIHFQKGLSVFSFFYREHFLIDQDNSLPNVTWTQSSLVIPLSENRTPIIQSQRVQETEEGLKLSEGCLILIQGPSGAGKTFFLKQLAQSLVDLKGKNSILFSPQEPWIYETSAPQTVAYPKLDLQSSLLTPGPFHLPSSIDEAHRWSRGEKQRLGFLRQNFWNRPVWLLDEITASLDRNWAQTVEEWILKRQWKFCFLISHENHLRDKADLILIFKNS
jgi:ABC-type multidrug transport system fused ATPase/permease subunit